MLDTEVSALYGTNLAEALRDAVHAYHSPASHVRGTLQQKTRWPHPKSRGGRQSRTTAGESALERNFRGGPLPSAGTTQMSGENP